MLDMTSDQLLEYIEDFDRCEEGAAAKRLDRSNYDNMVLYTINKMYDVDPEYRLYMQLATTAFSRARMKGNECVKNFLMALDVAIRVLDIGQKP